MAQGAIRKLPFSAVTFKLKPEANEPTLPATIAAASMLYKAATSKLIKVIGDVDVILRAAPDAGNNLTWRESGEPAEQYTPDITAAPSSPATFDLEIALGVKKSATDPVTVDGDPLSDLQVFLADSTTGVPVAVGQWAVLCVNILTKVGTTAGTIDNSAAADQGTLTLLKVKHNGLEVNVRSSAVQSATFRSVQHHDSAVWNYGPP